MTDEELTLVLLVKQKVEALNSSIESFGKSLHKETDDARRNYMAATELESFIPLKWLRRLRTPQVMDYRWRELDFVMQLERLLAAPEIDWRKLASQLNLYALNAALEMTRHKADKQLIVQVNEVAMVLETVRGLKPKDSSH